LAYLPSSFTPAFCLWPSGIWIGYGSLKHLPIMPVMLLKLQQLSLMPPSLAPSVILGLFAAMPRQEIETNSYSLERIDSPSSLPWDKVWDAWMANDDEGGSSVGLSIGEIPAWIPPFLHPRNNRLSAFLVLEWRHLR
jgi:hypothetical protein